MNRLFSAMLLLALPAAAHAGPGEPLRVERVDADSAVLVRDDPRPASVWLSEDTRLDPADRLVARSSASARLPVELPAAQRRYLILQAPGGATSVVAERHLPLERGSNFRDVGGYRTRDGRTVRWGKAFRSGAVPLLSERDYALLGKLGIDSIVDLRSLEEREVAPDLLDDRTGALFLSNDYSLKPLMARIGKGNGENMYRGMEKLLAPQYRSLLRRLLADEGALVYHCAAGQDRTGIATALLYDALGVDRATILADYHLSTALRRPQFELPAIDPAAHPDNPIVQYYARARAKGEVRAEPLFSRSGQSHLAQFFTYLDQQYGGTAGYFEKELGMTAVDVEKLKAIMLQ